MVDRLPYEYRGIVAGMQKKMETTSLHCGIFWITQRRGLGFRVLGLRLSRFRVQGSGLTWTSKVCRAMAFRRLFLIRLDNFYAYL